MWRLAGNLWESVLSIHWSTPGTELSSKRLCPLSHLDGSPSWSPGSFLISPLFPRHLSPRMPCLARQTSERDQGVAPETAAGAQGLHLPLLRDKPFLPDRPWFPWCSPVVTRAHRAQPGSSWEGSHARWDVGEQEVNCYLALLAWARSPPHGV